MSENKFIASLDIGTTTVRCYIFDKFGNTVGKSSDQVELLYPEPGFVEIDPDKLWNSIVFVMKNAILNAGLLPLDISCIGISSQRCTFLCWNKNTKYYYHNLITWKDLRADKLVQEFNHSYKMKALRFASKCLYSITGYKKYQAGSVLKFMNAQVAIRLLWVLKHVEGLSEGIEKNEVLFGTIDCWVLYRLTNGNLHVTDFSSASATGLFDPFTLNWASWALKLLGIPPNILPELVDTAGIRHFKYIHPSILGDRIPITASVADQSASIFGSLCFNVGDLKITLGSGTFLDVNTGSKPHSSVEGLYPIIGWKFKDELIYLAEVSSNDTGALTKWAVDSGLINNIRDSSSIAQSVENNGGVYFIPAFSGIQAPINDTTAAAGFIGIKPITKQAHMLRAVLESIVYRIAQLYEIFIKEMNCTSPIIKIDGGVSKNDFVNQFLADLINTPIERAEFTEMSALGAAYLAGLAKGLWKDKYELYNLQKNIITFQPTINIKENYKIAYELWCDAVTRFCGWYCNIN